MLICSGHVNKISVLESELAGLAVHSGVTEEEGR